MTKIVPIYEISLAILNRVTYSRVCRFVHAVFCLHYLLQYVGNIGINGITNGTIGKTLNDDYVRGSPNGKVSKSTNGTIDINIFTNGNPKILNVFTNDAMIGKSHGVIYVILINVPHSFLSFLFSTCIVLFIKFTFESMIKIVLIYEIHEIFLGSPH